MQTEMMVVAAVLVGLFSAARITRLITQDVYPPAQALRDWWDSKTKNSGWNDFLHCHWCMGPWVAGVVLLWGWLTDMQTAWWLFNGWLAAGYVTSMIVERDEIAD